MRGTQRRPSLWLVATLSILIGAVAGCPTPNGRHGSGGGGAAQVNPDECGNIKTNDVGRKVYSFLAATASLGQASADLESSVHGACARMANDLGIPATGDTKTLCTSAAKALRDNLQVSVSTHTQMVTRYTPPVCTTKIDFEASIVAECEASASANVSVQCDGTCGGTCDGACDGTCEGRGSAAACDGQCEGTCRGKCEGDCQGYVSVDASAECKASAEIQATTHTECTEPKVEVVQENVTVVDDTKFKKATAAIGDGMPAILQAGAKAALVAKAIVQWGETLASLVKSSADIVAQLGDKGVCVAGELAASFAASAQIEASISVSVSVSADVSTAAGASAQ